MKYYYADAQNKTAGPVSLEELQALVKAGALKSDPMVVPEGGSEWKPLSAFVAPGYPRAIPGSDQRPFSNRVQGGSLLPFSRTVLGDFVANALKHVSALLNEGFVNRSLLYDRNAGHFAILSGGALGLIYCIVIAIKRNELVPALVGIGFVIALAIGQFVAMRFLGAGDTLIANTPHRISSKAFLECCGLLALPAALSVWVSGLIIGIRLGGTNSFVVIIPALFYSTILLYLGALAFNPKVVNVIVGEGSAGEEAVGILGFFFKAGLKLVPIFFLFGGMAANLLIIFSFKENSIGMFEGFGSPFPLLGLLGTFGGNYLGLGLLLFACLLPIIAYLGFLLLNLGLEFVRAVLVIPAKLDKQTS